MSDEANVTKQSWLSTGIGNKIGSVIWAIVTVFYLIATIFMFQVKGAEEEYAELFNFYGVYNLVMFLLYLAVCVGIFFNNGLATSLGKAWGISTLVVMIAVVVLIIVLFAIVFNIIKEKFGIDIVGMVSDAMSTIKSASKAAADAASKASALAGDAAKSAAAAVAADPAAKAVASLFGKVMFVLVGVPVVTVLTIISSFMLSVKEGPKSRVVALVLCFFLGMFGGHCIYAKKTGKAVMLCIFTVTCILAPVSALIVLIDFIKILCGVYTDKNKEPIKAWV